MGKTDTAEFASSGRKALTTNPVNPAYTPGGSSVGSGAAVGDSHMPQAFGTQRGGSHVRPAWFNGLEPTWSLVSREDIRMSSISLDMLAPGGGEPVVGLRGRPFGSSLDDVVLTLSYPGEAALGLHTTEADLQLDVERC